MSPQYNRGRVEDGSFLSDDCVSHGTVRGWSVVVDHSRVEGTVDLHSIVANATIPATASVEQAVILESAGVMCGSIGGRTWCAYTRWIYGEWRVYIHIGCQQLFLDELTAPVIRDFAQQFSREDADHFECMIYAIAKLVAVGVRVPSEPFDPRAFMAKYGVPQEQFA